MSDYIKQLHTKAIRKKDDCNSERYKGITHFGLLRTYVTEFEQGASSINLIIKNIGF